LNARRASLLLTLILAPACAAPGAESPIGMIPDERARDVVLAAFDAHGAWADFIEAQSLSFEAKLTGPVAQELGDVMIGYVETASVPRSRWATHWGRIDFTHHAQIACEPPSLESRIPQETRQLLYLTSLFITMPMPLVQSAAPPTSVGERTVVGEKWDVLALPPAAMGLDLRALEVFVRHSTGFVEMLRADFGDGHVRWIRGFAARGAYKLQIFGDVRWYVESVTEPAGDPFLSLHLGELRSRPARQSFRQYDISPAPQ
jgi:hypothetical protein